jgi:site-specific recombinase XerD
MMLLVQRDLGTAREPRLLDQVRDAIRRRHYSYRTEQSYLQWIRRYIYFHQKRHPREMGEPEIAAFLTNLAVQRQVSASTQNQALNALLFLYKHVLEMDVGLIRGVVRAKRPKRLPLVMTREEVQAVLCRLSGRDWLLACLMYGAGLRVMECLRLRVKDIDFGLNQIVVRDGKGQKDRATPLPITIVPALQHQIGCAKVISPTVTERYLCLLRWRASIRTRRASFRGGTFFRPRTVVAIPIAVASNAITSMSRQFKRQ